VSPSSQVSSVSSVHESIESGELSEFSESIESGEYDKSGESASHLCMMCRPLTNYSYFLTYYSSILKPFAYYSC